jgi:hypothetical protein
MAYSDFTRAQLVNTLQITLSFQRGAFERPSVVPRTEFLDRLQDALRLIRSSPSEKARSEWLIAPTLNEVWRACDYRFTIFSGEEFNVDPARGLGGRCDFLLSAVPAAPVIVAPVVAVVEAKRDNFEGGIDQCGAELVAAQQFNEQERPIYGVVSNGVLWQFLSYTQGTLLIDDRLYDLLDEPGQVLGILQSLISEHLEPVVAAV